ncbi:MAG: DUF6120 family protein [Oscillospiraceae bacterium]
MRERQRQVNRYVRAVGSYLPCAGKHKKQLLTALRSEAEAYCAETRDADLEARFGTPQQVAAAYVDAMSTQELLAALRRRRQVLTILIAAVLSALLLWVAALCVSLYDYHQAYNGWSETSIIEGTLAIRPIGGNPPGKPCFPGALSIAAAVSARNTFS